MENMMIKEIAALLEEPDLTAALANVSACIKMNYDNLNWAGFYLVRNNELVLGPFQGKVACERIAAGRGVCGTALATGKVQLVEDVHEFPGHIACDCASNSEIVVPSRVNGEIWGVLDIDSPYEGRFTEDDLAGLSRFVNVLENVLFGE